MCCEEFFSIWEVIFKGQGFVELPDKGSWLKGKGGSSLSSSKGNKSDDGWFLEVLGRDSDCKGSHQLELFKVEMVVVHKGTVLVGKLDLLLHLVLDKGQA